jgi:hypothetical protein
VNSSFSKFIFFGLLVRRFSVVPTYSVLVLPGPTMVWFVNNGQNLPDLYRSLLAKMIMVTTAAVMVAVLTGSGVDALSVVVNDTKVASVIIFGSGMAEITRKFLIPESLPAGSHTVTITGLSSSLDERSLEITGVGKGEILDTKLTATSRPRESNSMYQSLLHDLQSQQRDQMHQYDLASRQIELLNERSFIFREYITFIFRTNSSMKSVHDAIDVLDVRDEQLKKIGEAVTQQTAILDQLSNERNNLMTAINGLMYTGVYTHKNGSQQFFDNDKNEKLLSFQIQLETPTTLPTHLFLRYFISPASWVAEYDVRVGKPTATTEGGYGAYDTEIDYFAIVSQQTGEDWNAIDLALSTSIPRQASTLPAPVSRGVYFEAAVPNLSKLQGQTGVPTAGPTSQPMASPTAAPTASPSAGPTAAPSYRESRGDYRDSVTYAAGSASSSGDMSASYLFKIPYQVNVTNVDLRQSRSIPRHRLLIDKVAFSGTLFTFGVPSTRTGAFLRLWSKLPAHSSTSLLNSPSARIFIEVNYLYYRYSFTLPCLIHDVGYVFWHYSLQCRKFWWRRSVESRREQEFSSGCNQNCSIEQQDGGRQINLVCYRQGKISRKDRRNRDYSQELASGWVEGRTNDSSGKFA